MKIISKFKDYYDYLVSKYGQDPILVFDRRNNSLLPQGVQQGYLHTLPAPPERWDFPLPAVAHSCLYVGHQAVYLFHTGEKVYTSFDLADVGHCCTKRYSYYCVLTFRDGTEYALGSYYFAPFDNFYGWRRHYSDLCMERLVAHADNRSREYQQPYRTIPLLLEYYHFADHKQDTDALNTPRYAENPQLSALGIFIDADFVWQNIVAYLSQLKTDAETAPPMDNAAKIASKGFDGKTSFRPKMKNNVSGSLHNINNKETL